MDIDSVYQGDSISLIKEIEDSSIHAIISDIPYGIALDEWDVLHNNKNSALLGKSPAQEKSPVFKKRGKPLNGWSKADRKIPKEYQDWCCSFSEEWLRVLFPGASCFVFAGRRLAHRCISAFEDSGFLFRDMLFYEKTAAPHRAQRISCVFSRRGDMGNADQWEGWKLGNLRPLIEPILWFQKPYKIGGTVSDNILEWGVGAYNEKFLKEFLDKFCENQGIEICSNIFKIRKEKDDSGLHPTQKPLKLMKLLISLVTKENQVILDPFCGSGTTLVAAKEMNRKYVGFEQNADFVVTSLKRLDFVGSGDKIE